MTKNGQKTGQNGQKWPKMAKNLLKNDEKKFVKKWVKTPFAHFFATKLAICPLLKQNWAGCNPCGCRV